MECGEAGWSGDGVHMMVWLIETTRSEFEKLDRKQNRQKTKTEKYNRE
jgi:hypothetical protein